MRSWRDCSNSSRCSRPSARCWRASAKPAIDHSATVNNSPAATHPSSPLNAPATITTRVCSIGSGMSKSAWAPHTSATTTTSVATPAQPLTVMTAINGRAQARAAGGDCGPANYSSQWPPPSPSTKPPAPTRNPLRSGWPRQRVRQMARMPTINPKMRSPGHCVVKSKAQSNQKERADQ